MSMNNYRRPRRVSGSEQFVLVTEEGKERTSNVTDERIFRAVYEVECNTVVGLEKCVPVAIGPSAYVLAMTYNENSWSSRNTGAWNLGKVLNLRHED